MMKKKVLVPAGILLTIIITVLCSINVLFAAEYTNGVDVSDTTATLWFKSGANTMSVDVHFNVNSGSQQNTTMTYNSATTRYEYKVNVATGNVIDYSFTYNDGTSAYDTSWFTYSVGGAIFYLDSDYNGNSVLLTTGSYTLSQLQGKGISNDSISSLKVPTGWTVEIFSDDNFTGTEWTFTENTTYVGSACNDNMSSVKITQSGGFPVPPALTDPIFNDFMSEHAKYYSGSTVSDIDSAYFPNFREYLQLSGGDAFVYNLLKIKPNLKICIVDNNNVPTGIPEITSEWVNGIYAYSIGDYVVFGKVLWDKYPDGRSKTLIHETMHHMDNGISTTATVVNLYNNTKNNTAAQWDDYAMTNPAEYLACGTEWVIKNDMYDASETKRERLKRMDPAFYNWLVNDFIPNKMYTTATSTNNVGGNSTLIYTIANDWGSGASISMTIKNNSSSAVSGWTLVFNFLGNQQITDSSCGSFTQSGQTVTVKNLDWNASIPAGGSVSGISFNVSYSGSNAKPASATVNSSACTVQ